ncbi:NlpC/P60 family protein [Streptomyces sp. NPDC020298]|uniref:C40 family peptidase n=1 Tax=unclassified Streptomyces TaxID=2593676 RepID=UPI0033EAB9FA
MTSGTPAAPVRRGLHARLLTVLLAAVLALLAAAADPAAARQASTTRPAAAAAADTAQVHQPVVTTPHGASRSVTRSTTHPAVWAAVRTIRLRPGDTLWGLAHRYGTTVAALQRANGLGASTLIYAGHHLTIPTSAGRAAHTISHPTHHRARHTTLTTPGAATAVAFARRQLGVPYLWGGSGNSGYDCSGLVRAAWYAAGVTLPRTATAQARAGIRIIRPQLQPGDLVFTHGYGHVQLYTGHGRVIEAAHPGTRVRSAPLPSASAVDAYRRPTDPARITHAAQATDRRPTVPAAGSARKAAVTVFGSQYSCAANIITRESGWKVTAANPVSGAYGLAQALPGSKMARYGTDWPTSPTTQLRWMRAYVNARYGSACNAWTFWQTHHWY